MSNPMTERTFTAADFRRRAASYEMACDCDSGPRMTSACSFCQKTAAMLRQGADAIAALTAAVERETKLREENERLRREADCHVSAESALETLARAETAEAEVADQRQKVQAFHGKMHEEFHRLWTKCVGTADYNKADWRALDGLIADLRALGLTPDPPREK